MIPRFPGGLSCPVRIGGGGFATVYRVYQQALERRVAVKIIGEQDRAVRRSLLREATTQAKLSIRCIPQVYDACEYNNNVYIIMQWIYGASLSTVLRGTLDAPRRLLLVDGIIRAVAELHAQGFAHRDIKPNNILVAPAEGIFLIDFGLTRNIDDVSMTVSGVVKGTPAYMAPENWLRNAKIDLIRADVYSLGKVVREILGEGVHDELTGLCLEEKPEKRMDSAVTLFAQWSKSIDKNTIDAQWHTIAQPHAANELARQLLEATRELVGTGRYDEAYRLLVECLDENPDMAEAVQLMSDFPALHRQKRIRRRMSLVLAMATVCFLVVSSFVIGRYGSRREAARITGLIKVQGQDHVYMLGNTARPPEQSKSRVLFLMDSIRTPLLNGELVVADCPATGELFVDNSKVAFENGRGRRLSLPGGEHVLVWKDGNGTVVWREIISLLPFQAMALCIRRR